MSAHLYDLAVCFVKVLADAGIDLSDIALRLDRNATPDRYPAESVYSLFGALEVRLRDVLLRHHLRGHACSRCRVRAVGVDGVQSVTSKVCQFAGGDVRTFTGANVKVDLGCQDAPQGIFRFCARHLSGAGPQVIQCENGHDIGEPATDAEWWHQCEHCSLQIPAGSRFRTCSHGCDYDICLSCWPKLVSRSWPAVPATQPTADVATDADEPFVNPCGLDKTIDKARRRRRYGGLIVAILPCGRVASLLPFPRGESLTLVHALLGEVRQVYEFGYVIYDNACALAKFSRAPRRQARSSTAFQLAQCVFVLDRFHLRNHKACLDVNHPQYLPEVNIYSHAELEGVNTTTNEVFNAWIGHYAAAAHNMHPATYRLYMFILTILWNECVASRGLADIEMEVRYTRFGHLRRVRRRLGEPTPARADGPAAASSGSGDRVPHLTYL